MRLAAGLLLPVWALAAAAGATDEAEAELRRTLLESDDPALIAQREYFPEHYETVVRLLARIRGATSSTPPRPGRPWAATRRGTGTCTPNGCGGGTRRPEVAAGAAPRPVRADRPTHGPCLCLRYEQGGV